MKHFSQKCFDFAIFHGSETFPYPVYIVAYYVI